MHELLDPQGGLRPWPVRYATEFKEETARGAAVVDDWVAKHGRTFKSLWELSLRPGDPFGTVTRLCWAAWHSWGRKSYMVAPILGEALRNTSLGQVSRNALVLPAMGVWIEGNVGTKVSPLYGHGMFVVRQEEDVSTPLYVDPDTREEFFPPAKDVLLYDYVIGTGSKWGHAVGTLWLSDDDLQVSINRSLEFAARIAKARGVDTHSDPTLIPDSMEYSQERGLGAVAGFLVNALLYIASPEADLQMVIPQGLEKPPKSAKAREIQERIRGREGEVHAAGYRLARVVREKDGKRRVLDAEALRNPPKGHLVTGHWKHQPYGPERSLRKYIYILPYWRGEGGEEEHIERKDLRATS